MIFISLGIQLLDHTSVFFLLVLSPQLDDKQPGGRHWVSPVG